MKEEISVHFMSRYGVLTSDHHASAEKQAEDPSGLMLPLVRSLSLLLYNLWIRNRDKRTDCVTGVFEREASDHQTATELWKNYPNFFTSE